MMNDSIWTCDVNRDTSLARGFKAFVDDGEEDIWTPTHTGKIASENSKGLPLSEDDFPKQRRHRKAFEFKQRLPPIFHTGHVHIGPNIQEILKQFDLGNGGLYPVKLYQHDKATLISEDYAQLHIGNQKDTVILEESPCLQEIAPNYGVYHYLTSEKDDELAVHKSADEAPDIWADPKMMNTIFFSSRLAEALISAGFKKACRLTRCRTF